MADLILVKETLMIDSSLRPIRVLQSADITAERVLRTELGVERLNQNRVDPS